MSISLHHKILGQGSPLILLHGLFGSADNWGSIAKHFAKTHQVISVDLRNHGRSPHHASHTYQDMTADLLTLLNELNLDTAHLIGHSMGGKLAMQFATQHPERLRKLIIVDMAIRAYPDEHSHLIDAMLAVDLNIMQSRTEIDKALREAIPETMVRQFLLMNLVKTDDGCLQWRINLPALKNNYTALQQAITSTAQYHQPCLFIRGERSHYISNADIAQIQQYFTQAQFVDLPSDHWVHAEQPKAFIEAVADFIQ